MEELINTLKKYNQNHIIEILEKIDKNKQEELIEQLNDINFEQIEELYKNLKTVADIELDKIEPIKATNKDKLSAEEIKRYEDLGIDVIKNNQFAVVTMSGGQGTRLGFNGPKGTFKIDVEPKPKYLFEIIVDTLKAANKKYGVTIPWYIMTSEENDETIKEFMEQNNWFGYDENSIKYFKQGELPLIDLDGKLLIDEKYNVKSASNGNGSIFESMRTKGVLADMESKNIKWVYIGSIDNVLLKMIDVLLMGIAIDQKSLIATRSIFKNNARERIGSLCSYDGKIKVIEYSELPEEMIEAVDEEGELLYGESHVMCNLFNIEALKKVSTERLPYHKAFKKYSYIDKDLNLIKPEEPNAYKFEYFIFDSFEYFDKISILRGKREEDFAPVKNASGVDSPETAIKLYNDYWRGREQ